MSKVSTATTMTTRGSAIFRALKAVEDDGCCLIIPDEVAEEGKLQFVDEHHVTQQHFITCMQDACKSLMKPAQTKKVLEAAINVYKLQDRLSMFTEKDVSKLLDDLVEHLFADTFVIRDDHLHLKSLAVKGSKGRKSTAESTNKVPVGSPLETLTDRTFYLKFVELYGWKAKGMKPAITRTFSRICAAARGVELVDKENTDANCTAEDTKSSTPRAKGLGKRNRIQSSEPVLDNDDDDDDDNEHEGKQNKKLRMTLRSRLGSLRSSANKKSSQNKCAKRDKASSTKPTRLNRLTKEDTKTFLTKLLTQSVDPAKLVVGGKLIKMIL